MDVLRFSGFTAPVLVVSFFLGVLLRTLCSDKKSYLLCAPDLTGLAGALSTATATMTMAPPAPVPEPAPAPAPAPAPTPAPAAAKPAADNLDGPVDPLRQALRDGKRCDYFLTFSLSIHMSLLHLFVLPIHVVPPRVSYSFPSS